MRVPLTPCFILHQRPYRETSLLLEIFSREHGRINLVAKGIKRNKNKSQALFQAHRSLNISWSGRGELFTLTEVETNGPGLTLKGEFMIAAFYLNELLIRLLHKHESHPELFDAYVMALTRLQHGQSEMIALRYFEKQLLDSLGYGLVLDHELDTGDVIHPHKQYFYSIDHGPTSGKPAHSNYVKVSGSILLALDQEDLDEQTPLEELKQLMRLTLNGYLGEKPLASRDLYRAYIKQKQKGV